MDVHTVINNLKNLIQEHDLYIDWIFKHKDADLEVLKAEMNTSIEVVYQEGGFEGDGDYTCGVLYFSKYDLYLKCEGTHSSYDGVYYSNIWTQVFPKQITTIVYTNIK